ncbi:MAG: hypothetical protein IJB52_14515 [Clostridia bacterium]|nr:hypothetical protein [Clostridia bacterium]
MKKNLLLLLLAGLLTVQMVSCGAPAADETAAETNGAADAETVAETEAETTPLEAMGTADFDGKTYTILDANDHPYMHINIHIGETNGEPINDAIYNRDQIIADSYNAVIAYEQTDPCKPGATAFQNNVVAGDETYSMIIGPALGSGIASLANAGVLFNLNELSSGADANWASPWWSSLMYDTMQLNGKFLYTTGDIASSVYQAPFCVFYNVDMGLDYGYDPAELYEMVNNGEWTYSELFAMTKDMNADLNGDNAYTHLDDFAGVIIQKGKDTINALLTSCGVHMSEIDAEGKLVVDLNNEFTITAAEMLHTLYNPVFEYTDNKDPTHRMFPEARGLFMIHKVETATAALREMEDDFAILPMPKYDTEQSGYNHLLSGWVDCFIGLPKNLTDTEFAGFITEALARASFTLIRPAAFETTLKGKTARDAESLAMLDIIFNTLYLDFNCLNDFGTICDKVATNVIAGQGLASVFASTESAVQSAIDKVTEVYSQE